MLTTRVTSKYIISYLNCSFFLFFFFNKTNVNTCFPYLRAAEDQKIFRIHKRYVIFTCDLKIIIPDGKHLLFSHGGFPAYSSLSLLLPYCFFLSKTGHIGFLSCRLSILSRSTDWFLGERQKNHTFHV